MTSSEMSFARFDNEGRIAARVQTRPDLGSTGVTRGGDSEGGGILNGGVFPGEPRANRVAADIESAERRARLVGIQLSGTKAPPQIRTRLAHR